MLEYSDATRDSFAPVSEFNNSSNAQPSLVVIEMHIINRSTHLPTVDTTTVNDDRTMLCIVDIIACGLQIPLLHQNIPILTKLFISLGDNSRLQCAKG